MKVPTGILALVLVLSPGPNPRATAGVAPGAGKPVIVGPTESDVTSSAFAKALNDWAMGSIHSNQWAALAKASVGQILAQAEQGSALAQLKLGWRYFGGSATATNLEAGLTWLQRAADQGLAPAQYLIGRASWDGLVLPRDEKAAVEWLTKAAEQDFADAQFALGLIYLNGSPGPAPQRSRVMTNAPVPAAAVNRAPVRALKWLHKAAMQDKPEAQLCLAHCYETGEGVTPDPAAAKKWYYEAGNTLRRKADQGERAAQDLLAVCFARGIELTPDPAEAIRWCRRAAEHGNPIAQNKLAFCYAAGTGLPIDPGEAVKWWAKAAGQGCASAQFYLGLAYYEGKGVTRDLGEAAEWWRRAVNGAKLPSASLYLGLCYWKGQGLNQDKVQAEELWRFAITEARIGDYDLGDGSPSDTASGEKWWRAVAEMGGPRLQYWLGQAYHLGKGIPRDTAEALRWYSKAADAGEVSALNAAAWMMATSEDAQLRNGAKAVQFAETAAALTHNQEAGILDTLAAAYAEAGQFEKAVATGRRAAALTRHGSLKAEIEARVRSYETNAPCRAKDDLIDFSR